MTDMIQILCAGGKNVKLTITHDTEEAELYIDTGEIVHVQLGDLAGEKAFYELMRWEEGDFSTQQCSEFPERTVHLSAMSLLMEGARIADEMGE